MQNHRRRQFGVCGSLLWALSVICAAHAADHDDTPALKDNARHEARLTDLHVFTDSGPRGEFLIITLASNPTIPPTAESYTFPSDLKLSVFIDRDSAVDFDADPDTTAEYGGTIERPGRIEADIVLTTTFDSLGAPQLTTTVSQGDGDSDDGCQVTAPRTTRILEENPSMRYFVGLRDDPFIRGPRQGRNIGAIAFELPLDEISPHGDPILVWATSEVPGPAGPMGDLGARALRSQLAPHIDLNFFTPAEHYTELGVVPDVVIFDPEEPATFPNGRMLTDDVVDLVGDEGVLSTDCPTPGDPVQCNPSTNDLAFLNEFPYLAAPQGAATGAQGLLFTFDGEW